MEANTVPKLRCPKCGQTRNFRVGATTTAIIENVSLYSYENTCLRPDMDARCDNCRHVSSLSAFIDAERKHVRDVPVATGDALNRL